MAKYDKLGREIPDPTPVEVPLHLRQAEPTIQEMIAAAVRRELSQGDAVEEALFSDPDWDEEDIANLPSVYEVDADVEDGVEFQVRQSRRKRSVDGKERGGVEWGGDSHGASGDQDGGGKPAAGAEQAGGAGGSGEGKEGVLRPDAKAR